MSKTLAELIEETSRADKPAGRRKRAKRPAEPVLGNDAGRSDADARAVAPAAETVDGEKLRRFCHALLFECHFNATEAYLQVYPGVTRGSAAELGSKLLKNLDTRQLLADMARAATMRGELNQDYIIGCWVAISQADVMDFFETDDKGTLTLRNLAQVDPRLRRNIASLKVTTSKINEMVTEQKVELKLWDKVGVLRDMGNAAGLLRDLGEKQSDNIAAAIEQGFDRVRKQLGGRTFDAAGVQIPDGEVVNGR